LPFPEWKVLLRNWRSGELREIAASDPRVAETPGLHPGLPNGFAPNPIIGDGRVVWDEHFVTSDGVGKRIQSYDLATQTTVTLHEESDATATDLRLPTAAGGKVAWIHTWFNADATTADFLVEVIEPNGDLTRFELPGEPWQIGLSQDGRLLFWDDHIVRQNVTDMDTLTTKIYSDQRGWGVYMSNGRTTVGWPLGDWFVWNILVSGEGPLPDAERSFLYFAPID